MKKVGRNTVNLLLCIAEILVGVLLLINPIAFTKGIIMVIGVVLAIVGIGALIRYFRSAPEEAVQRNGLAIGLILTLLGLFCVLKSEWLLITFPLLTALYGILTLANGISKVQWAVDMLRMKQKYWFVAIIGAILTLLFAVLILANPFATTAVLWTFIAITLIVEAIVDILAFLFGRQ